MRYLKDYSKYRESLVIDIATAIDLMESLNIWHDTLLRSIDAEEQDLFGTLGLKSGDFNRENLDLDFLCGDGERDPDERFVNALTGKKWKKSEVLNTDDYETFLNKPCKFMFIYRQDSNELESPIYLMLQTSTRKNSEGQKDWSEVKLYKFNGDAKKFYDKLSSKTIEIFDGGENYIYTTSNGNEWTLKNSENENDVWRRIFRKDELQDVVNDRNVSITII